MIEIRDKALCCGCGACAAACMPRCIKMSIDEEGFSYPIVAEALCSGCGACEKVCPFLNPFRSVNTKGVYLLRNRDISVRQRSSSGGAFALLAELFCQQDGLVFGAALNQDIVCVHSCADNLDGCREFMGSKYVQSDLGNSYMKAGEALKAGRQVFFSGTPCQVAGLKHYLGREYDNLFCADFICHGVPSPGVFALYVDGLRNKYPNLKTPSIPSQAKGLAECDRYVLGNGRWVY